MKTDAPTPDTKTHPLLRHSPLYLRILGGIALVGGLLLRLFGDEAISIDSYGVHFSLPLEYIFFVGGLLLLFLPLLFIYTLALALPEKYKVNFLEYLDRLNPEYQKLKENPGPENFAALLYNHIHRTNIRTYLFILFAVIFSCVVLPLIGLDFYTRWQFKRDSERLVALVQETRIDFTYADDIRARLRELEGLKGSKAVATRQIYKILSELFDPAIGNNPEGFKKALDQAHWTYIQKDHSTPIGVLRIEDFKLDKSSAESDLAAATYLTLLATICNNVGKQGTLMEPYIQGIQLLNLADSYKKESDIVPATHNARGVNLAGLIQTYDDFEKKFQDNQAAQIIQSSLKVNGKPSRLFLLRQAIEEDLLAEKQSASNLAKARTKNNRVSAFLPFLYSIYIENNFRADMIQNTADEQFLKENLAWGEPPDKLLELFDKFDKELSEATGLSNQREIYYTKAQLRSIGGELGEKQKLGVGGKWTNSELIANLAVEDLRTARNLHLPSAYFEYSFAVKHQLKWLWGKRETQIKELTNP